MADPMNQQYDRITQILQERASQPQYPNEMGQTNAIAGQAYSDILGGRSPGNFVGDIRGIQQQSRDQPLNDQMKLLQVFEAKKAYGDKQAQALDERIKLFTGGDPEGTALILGELHNDPEEIDPSNSFQTMTKIAGIVKKNGYKSPVSLNPKVDNDNFKHANTLRDEFNTLTKDFRSVQDAYSKIAKTSNTGAGDMSMLYQYVKLLDPGSVVRESEFASAAAAGSFGERVQGALKSIESGGRLPPSLRQEFIKEAENIYQGQKAGYDRQKVTYRGLANKFQVDQEMVITDYTETPTGNQQPPIPNGWSVRVK